MPLHLKTGDGDLLIITEPSLLMRCAWQSHAIYRAAPIPRILQCFVNIEIWGKVSLHNEMQYLFGNYYYYYNKCRYVVPTVIVN